MCMCQGIKHGKEHRVSCGQPRKLGKGRPYIKVRGHGSFRLSTAKRILSSLS